MFKNKLFLIGALSAVIVLTGCNGSLDAKGLSDGISQNEGVSQGNGMTAYVSKDYKYAVSYNSKLKLNELSESEVVIDNTPLLMARDPVSSLRLKALEKGDLGGKKIGSLEDLKKFLHFAYPTKNWQRKKFSGASGFASISQNPTESTGDYFVFLGKDRVIRGQMEAHVMADGIAFVTPIMDTFAVDIAPPSLLAMNPLKGTVQAESTGTLLFKAIDDVSGVNLAHTSTQGRFKYLCDGSACERADISVYGRATKGLGDDWYSIDFEVGRYVPAGEYILESFSVRDLAGNSLLLWAYAGDSTYKIHGSSRETNIPVVRIKVENSGAADTSPPNLMELKAERTSIRAGEDSSLRFKAKDDASGLNLNPTWTQGRLASEKGMSQTVEIYGPATRSLGDDWFSIDFHTGNYLPSGKYFLQSFMIADAAGNQLNLWANSNGTTYRVQGTGEDTNIPVVRIEVRNEDREDAVPPVVTQLKMQSSAVGKGTKGVLIYQAKDDVSGMNLGWTWTQGRFQYVAEGGSSSATIDIYGPAPMALGGDWYSIEFDVGAFVPPGEYVLEYFTTCDLAKNTVALRRAGSLPTYKLSDGRDSGVALVKIQVQ